ncbi:SGNH/GDSL hydrolase family protein [Sphingobacterium rhinopitheci]|uniref:SGNH/GDSL hydrolase family protein n=1 Tax=Sphingobacterium rhinopitheci TaxID=2781960 RepID=UPI001F516145|nr:SGNH/GDSL hydrolase family protein [Sphingobacterium rhinopitheci]MCI0921168.1 SGNH/GDSL hydrolase family protein [Sphingobacterium rhinopitheci]
MNNRRKFLKQTLATIGTTLIGSQLLKAESILPEKSKITLQQNDVILFQGDSITDHGRNRDVLIPNDINGMGRGYAMVAASAILNQYAGKNIAIYNRGISGHKVPQLEERWQKDCIDLKPNILSILIGVNDYWHTRDGKYKGTAVSFKESYQRLLDNTLKNLPNVQLIIGEPFAVKKVKHVDDTWYPEFLGYQKVARDIAKEYKALLIPYQEVFDKAEKRAAGNYWTTDGVHTTLAGVNLMAEAWLTTLK